VDLSSLYLRVTPAEASEFVHLLDDWHGFHCVPLPVPLPMEDQQKVDLGTPWEHWSFLDSFPYCLFDSSGIAIALG